MSTMHCQQKWVIQSLCFGYMLTACIAAGYATEVPEAAKAGWRELEESVRDYQYTARTTSSQLNEDVFCAKRGQLLKRVATMQKRDLIENRVDLLNETGFTLYKVGNAWQVGQVFAAGEPFPQITYVTTLPENSFSINTNLRLRDIVDNPNYRVIDWKTAPVDPTKILMTVESTSDLNFTKAIVTLDPERLFHVLEITYHGHRDEIATWKCEYELDSELRDAIPSSYVCLTGDIRWTITSASKTPPPESEFTLAYYGLSDSVPSRGRNYWLWLTGFGAIIAIAVLLFRRKREW